MAKRNKRQPPSDPQEIAARRVEKRELEARGLVVNADPRDAKILAVWRPDCFTLLLKGRTEEQGAVTWLETLIRTASGENGQERRPDYIRGSAEGAPGQNVSQAMIDADLYLVAATEALTPQNARMLLALLCPDAALEHRWRAVVQRCTGETNPQAQGAAVRAACSQLLWVQGNIDRLVRERGERRAAA